ncbi:choice-of-anchor B family protein [Pleionea sp. CnH1-48]|uniref:choice-of-anchor B family protein n=1 Tax=Pleionea sp. CnH1-48 TaxID=2954494 RepID=UPI002096A8FD|nr:choice-of-anchor B family protein [Pleionea sp. CnH1-48]MCO7227031.1 choice-of-anchor B family protein [Pleionea sp. CnH1-48]
MRWKYLIPFAIASVTSSSSIWAHSGAHPVRFVAPDGKDAGECSTAVTRCKTISYAVNQSGKGDSVKVASGSYHVQGDELFFLLSDMVQVNGGYTVKDGYRKQDTNKYVTTITGIPAEYRAQLAERGFNLVQDKKGQATKLSKRDREMLDTYQKMTNKIEGPATCTNGQAATYDCDKVDLHSHFPLNELSSRPSSMNDIWGFVDLDDNREYAIVGLQNGTTVIDVTDPTAPREIGTISGQSSGWRDVKVYQCRDETTNQHKAWAYVTTEASQGLQVIDLSNLPNSINLTRTISDFSTAHNVYMANVDYTTGVALPNMEPYMYIAGANRDGGAYRVFSMADPSNPALVTTPPVGTGYVHDATTLVIDDARTSQCAAGHNPCELLIDFNEKTVDIWDMTNKAAPFKISETPYNGASYTHSGWWSADKNFIFIQDELDEQNLGLNTTVRTLDIRNLQNPTLTHTWTGPDRSIDHNGFTKGNHYYMSTYRSGLTILDVSNPNNISRTGYFDTFMIPAQNSANFNGAWGTYPYLPSGNILVSDIEYGLFVLKDNTNPTGYSFVSQAKSCGTPNGAPVARVSQASQTIAEGTNVVLDASSSSDPDNDTLTYTWTQTGGANVTMSNANTARMSFTAPDVTTNTILTFQIAVSDGKGGNATATASVTVTDQSGNGNNNGNGNSGGGGGPVGLAWLGLLLLPTLRKRSK